jgi:hypothetical protein
LYSLFLCGSFSYVNAETVTGGGYVVEQTIAPIEGAVSGNGYSLQQASQQTGNEGSGGGYASWSVFGPGYTAPVVTPPGGGGGSSGGGGGFYNGGLGWGWGYYILPKPSNASSTATSSLAVNSNTILTANGSTCSTRITLSQPIDVGLLTNKKEDVEKLETFLNTYEQAKLPVNGVYEARDVVAVKKWQAKYRTLILAPMKLKNPTGTIYTLSLRQIERQTASACGQSIIVHSCPFFTIYTKAGDQGGEVKKIQQFLNIVQGEKLSINGIYGPSTVEAAKRFQRLYRKDIISIVTLSFISGNWNVSTRTKANEVIGCDILK